MKFQGYLLDEAAKKARTEFLETASMIGAVCSSSFMNRVNKILDDPKNINRDYIEKTLEDTKKILDKDYDWSKEGVSDVRKLTVSEDNMVYIIDLFSLIKGMNTFMKNEGNSIVGTKPKFVHSQIRTYYKIEKSVLGIIAGAKANTADVIICNVQPDKLFAAMKDGDIKADEKLRYVMVGKKIKCIQVSLKKSEKGAQLGRIASYISKSLGYGTNPATAVSSLTDSTDYSKLIKGLDIIEEGVWDRIKTFAKELWDKVTVAIKKIISPFLKKWLKVFKSKPNKKHMNDFFMEVGLNSNLTEDLSEGTITAKTQEMIDTVAKNPEKVYKVINNQILKLDNEAKTNDTVCMVIKTIKPKNKFKGKESKAVFSLIGNYLALRIFIDMVNDSRSMSATVNRLIAEMMFGGTKLPLWKVYGDYGDGHAYAYMGTIDTFMKEKKTKKELEVIGIRITPQDDYYTIMALMLEGVYKEGKKYVSLRTGSSSSSQVLFIMGGTSIRGPYEMDKSLKEILEK